MFLITARLLLFAIVFHAGAKLQKRWREELLDQARERILSWYSDPSLLEPPETLDGVAIRMLKQDQFCAGDNMPVTFAEFDVKGARPIDVFNTMLDTSKQQSWNPQVTSATDLGDFKSDGARAWAVVFHIPLLNTIEIVQWQVADANFSSEEFWLVFSTQNNDVLKKVHPLNSGAAETQNCLGAYHITKHAEGAHVVVTQHVNPHIFVLFPMHQILKFFPPAWDGTLDFVHQLSDNSRNLAQVNSSGNFTDAPRFMLHGPERTSKLEPARSPSLSTADTFPSVQPSEGSHAVSWFFRVMLVCASIVVSLVGFAIGRFIAGKIHTAADAKEDSRETMRAISMESLAE